jgi:hypothetical protein
MEGKELKNQLRIGNLVEYKSRIYKIWGITEECPILDTKEFKFGEVKWEDLKPVLISEELKFNFRVSKAEYAHEIQNLHFALFGNELKIDGYSVMN